MVIGFPIRIFHAKRVDTQRGAPQSRSRTLWALSVIVGEVLCVQGKIRYTHIHTTIETMLRRKNDSNITFLVLGGGRGRSATTGHVVDDLFRSWGIPSR